MRLTILDWTRSPATKPDNDDVEDENGDMDGVGCFSGERGSEGHGECRLQTLGLGHLLNWDPGTVVVVAAGQHRSNTAIITPSN